jgi:hypothetical protein
MFAVETGMVRGESEMRGTRLIGAAAAVAMTLSSAAVARDHGRYGYNHYGHRHDGDSGAAVGAILGLAIVGVAAAAASKKNRDDRRDWGNAYSPAPDITCYSDQRQCFWRDRFSPDWTDSQFGYDPYDRGGY